jgi:hypothetical protein
MKFMKPGEFQPSWTKNKQEWGKSDALSWFLGTERQDFTFRTQMFSFAKGLKIKRNGSGFKAKVGQRY